MNIEDFSNLVTSIGAIVAILSAITAGIIFLWKREWRTRLQMTVGVDSFSKIEKSFLIEPFCTVENKGLLRCYVYKLDMSVRYILNNDKLEQGSEKLLQATKFPHKAVKIQFVKPEWEWSYVEAGIKVRYSHVIHIPEETVAILIWVKLYNRKNSEDDFYSTQRVFTFSENKLVKSE